MRSVVVDHPGGPEVLTPKDVAAPDLTHGTVRVAVAAAAVNWGDIQKRAGWYPEPVAYPCVLGMEVCGLVTDVASDVPRHWLGQRVAALTGPRLLGGYASEVVVPRQYLIALPPTLDWLTAASFPVATLTAYHLLRSAARTRPGDVVLVHSIAGSVGLALLQLGQLFGATIIGTVGSSSRSTLPQELGASLVIDRSQQDFVEAALDFTDGRGVDLVIDSVGGDVLPRSFDAVRTYGHVVNIGEASGDPDFPVRETLYRKSTSLAGFELLHAVPGSRRWAEGVQFVVHAVSKQLIHVPIGDVEPLEHVARLHAGMQARTGTGKPVALVQPNL